VAKIDCGPATAHYEIGNDGVLRTWWSGLLVPANAAELSARLLRVAAESGARGILGDLGRVLLAIPPVRSSYYNHVPPESRAVPVSFVVTSEQAPLYRDLAHAAAGSGTLRRAARCVEDSEQWMEEQVRAFAANDVWWKRRHAR
jgi:hypothetical protein